MLTKQEIFDEYGKCLMDYGYAIETYLKTFDKTQEGFVPFKLFPKQKEIIQGYRENRFNMVTKPRQAGVSTTTAAYAAIKVCFADPNNPEAVLVLANKQDMAFEFLAKIKDFILQVPRWVWGSEYYGTPKKEEKSIFLTESKKEIKLPNGSRIKAVATSKDALRGYTPTWLIMDEAAFIDDGDIVFGAALTALGTGGAASLISTPNGMDKLYYKTYEQSKKGKNNFNIIEMKWYQDPRYNKDLTWINEEDEDDIVEEIEFTYESYEKMIKAGYKPSSHWYREMCRGMNNDAKMIAQELDVSFIGSGGNVINDKYILKHEKENIEDPIYVEGDGDSIWVWEPPVEGHEYIIAVDVSRGDGADSSTFVIIDFTTMTQVAEFQDKLQPDLVGIIVDEWARKYNALVVIDITGGIGVGTVNKCLALGTPNIYYGESTKGLNKLNTKGFKFTNEGKYPGLNVSAGLRAPIVRHLEMMVRTMSITIRSKRLLEEMRTFVFKNGRADHMDGFHDDLLMALAYGLWVSEHGFKELKKAKKASEAMLNAWTNGTKEHSQKNMQVQKKRVPNYPHIVTKNMQDPKGDYFWLFGGFK